MGRFKEKQVSFEIEYELDVFTVDSRKTCLVNSLLVKKKRAQDDVNDLRKKDPNGGLKNFNSQRKPKT